MITKDWKRKRENSSNWKGDLATKGAIHKWLKVNFGKPSYCINVDCLGKCIVFDWCLKTGFKYSHNPDNYIWLCRSCHRKYDLTPAKKEQAIKNLIKHNPYGNKNSYKKYLAGRV